MLQNYFLYFINCYGVCLSLPLVAAIVLLLDVKVEGKLGQVRLPAWGIWAKKLCLSFSRFLSVSSSRVFTFFGSFLIFLSILVALLGLEIHNPDHELLILSFQRFDLLFLGYNFLSVIAIAIGREDPGVGALGGGKAGLLSCPNVHFFIILTSS